MNHIGVYDYVYDSIFRAMAFLFKDQRSSYWQAGWKDEYGKRINRSTKIPAKANRRREAQKIADEFESASKQKRAAIQVRDVISSLHKDLTGEEFPSATVREYTVQFLERKAGESSKATLAFYKTAFRDFLEWLEDKADQDLSSIRSKDIVRFRNHLLTKVSETTVTNKIKALRALFSIAHKEGFCLEEPTSSLKLSRKGKQDHQKLGRRSFTLDELKLIRSEATGEWESMILFGLYTGQRLGDLAMLRWNNLDLERNELRLQTLKTGRPVTIPLSSVLIEHVASMSASDDPGGFVHPKLAKHYEKQPSTLSNQFNALLASCGLRKPVSHQSVGKGRDEKREETIVSFHSLRATAVTLLHEAGIPAATVEEWVGHDSAEVHRAYIKIGRETLQKASDALPEI